MKKWISLLLSALFCGGCTGKSDVNAPQNGSYRQVAMDEAIQIMNEETGYIILDVRRPDEFASGHIPGATLYPHDDISEQTCETILPNKEQRIFVYCRSGRRSKIAAQKLIDLKYANIIEIGGINDYNGERQS